MISKKEIMQHAKKYNLSANMIEKEDINLKNTLILVAMFQFKVKYLIVDQCKEVTHQH